MRLRGVFFALVLALAPAVAFSSSNLRARVATAIQRLEDRIQGTRWNLNTLAEKRGLERELALLKKLYDKIMDHESDLMTLGCSGATIDPDDGPPRSTDASDDIGTLSMRATELPRAGGAAGAGGGFGGGDNVGGSVGPFGFQLGFAREITDVEVQLLAEIVYIDDLLEHKDWHFNNLDEQRELKRKRASALNQLRRVRNSRC